MPTLDHLVWAAPDLEAGIQELEHLTGVRARPGGSHPSHGTRNALATLENNTYFEILAPDPTLDPGTLAQQIISFERPALISWAARTPKAEATATLAEQAGYSVNLYPMSRETPDGRTLRWKIVRVAGHGGGHHIPFFIDWLDTSHPSLETPPGLTLEAFAIEAVDPDPVRAVLETLEVQVEVVAADIDQLIARLNTPKGEVVLTGTNKGYIF